MFRSLLYKYVLLLAFTGCVSSLLAQLPKKGPFYQTSISLGPVLSFYKENPNHTSGEKSGAAFTASFRGHFRLGRSASFLIGAQYLVHSNRFNSYYFPDSTLQLYDKNFNYEYVNRYHDLIIPVGIRINLIHNRQKASSFYTELTWGFKRRFASSMQINSAKYGNSVYDDKAGDKFQAHNTSTTKTANTIALGFGFDKNFADKKAGWYIGLTYTYGLNTFYFNRTRNMPGGLYQFESFAALTAGIRF